MSLKKQVNAVWSLPIRPCLDGHLKLSLTVELAVVRYNRTLRLRSQILGVTRQMQRGRQGSSKTSQGAWW